VRADIGDSAARRNDVLAGDKRGRYTHRVDGG
jgi:hypothetical protein